MDAHNRVLDGSFFCLDSNFIQGDPLGPSLELRDTQTSREDSKVTSYYSCSSTPTIEPALLLRTSSLDQEPPSYLSQLALLPYPKSFRQAQITENDAYTSRDKYHELLSSDPLAFPPSSCANSSPPIGHSQLYTCSSPGLGPSHFSAPLSRNASCHSEPVEHTQTEPDTDETMWSQVEFTERLDSILEDLARQRAYEHKKKQGYTLPPFSSFTSFSDHEIDSHSLENPLGSPLPLSTPLAYVSQPCYGTANTVVSGSRTGWIPCTDSVAGRNYPLPRDTTGGALELLVPLSDEGTPKARRENSATCASTTRSESDISVATSLEQYESPSVSMARSLVYGSVSSEVLSDVTNSLVSDNSSTSPISIEVPLKRKTVHQEEPDKKRRSVSSVFSAKNDELQGSPTPRPRKSQASKHVNCKRPERTVKRLRLEPSTEIKTSRFFAKERASLRKASSLLSVANRSFEQEDSEKEAAIALTCLRSFIPPDARTIYDANCPPTVPTTPASLVRPHPLARIDFRPPRSPPRIPFPIPLLAPPTFEHIPRAPLSGEDAAEARLNRLLEQERKGIDGDNSCSETRSESDKLESSSEYGGVIMDLSEPKKDSKQSQRFVVPDVPRYWEKAFGIDNGLRKEAVEWILDVLPGSNLTLSPEKASSLCPDLYEQLLTSAQTRFHAAYMFLRYFFTINSDREQSESSSDAESISEDASISSSEKLFYEGEEIMVWDTAVACIALSVKYHRDVLPPLCPVCSRDFLSLSPHEMSYDQLESAQRDILASSSYVLRAGDAQPFIDELWLALPTLRALLNWTGALDAVETETWGRLYWAITEPDVLRFPVSLLTGVALMDAVILILAQRLKEGHLQRKVPCLVPGADDELIRRAARAAELVLKDVQDVMQINDEDLEECQAWWSSMGD